MSLTELLNRPMTLVRRSASGDIDESGDEIQTEEQVEVVGELQQQQRDEPGSQGEFSSTKWLLILPAGTAIDTGDQVVCDGQVYEVVGDPWAARNPRTEAEHHVEATLKRTAGEETGS